ncbi:hypothetical protein B0H13DRAFT_1896983 [Mycena leptocephala]|nr:hypothetical protein B0H13DRAFT_1896983 [Mycena leptocephala]
MTLHRAHHDAACELKSAQDKYKAQAPVHSSLVRGAGSCYVVAAARITVREETFGDGLSAEPHRIPRHPLHHKSHILTVPTCIFLRHPRLAVHITSFPSHHPVYRRVKASPFIQRVLEAEAWPVNGSLGDLLIGATGDFTENIWNTAFSLDDFSWLSELVVPECLRSPSSSCLRRSTSPSPVLVGISRPLNFQLPLSPAAHAVMFAGGSGIAPFRSFWKARLGSPGVIGRNILFLGVKSRDKFLYKHELRKHVLGRKLEIHVAFSPDKNGLVYDPVRRDLVDKKMDERYIDAAIIDEGATVADMAASVVICLCGSLSLYETVIVGVRNALYKYRAVAKTGADELLAQAFAERRFMLDVFMTPRVMKVNEPMIPPSELSFCFDGACFVTHLTI